MNRNDETFTASAREMINGRRDARASTMAPPRIGCWGMNKLALAFCGVLLVAPSSGYVASLKAGERQDNIEIERDPETFTATIIIHCEGGRIAWSDLLRGLARARGYEDSALDGLLPDKTFRVTSRTWTLAAWALDFALGRGVDISIDSPHQREADPKVVIILDRAALLASQRRFKARIRNALSPARTRRRPELLLNDGCKSLPIEKNLVVLVHGLESNPEAVEGLLSAVPEDAFPRAAFRYGNDQPIADSARALARELARFAEGHPGRGVSLVTHSMGGLVVRAVIEDPDLDPGNVRQLIMVAPPNHGSALARFGFALDLAEHVANPERRKEIGLLSAMVEDGLSEATGDLVPGSPFLVQLNARGRNDEVQYTVFLGTKGVVDEEQMAEIRGRVARAGTKNRWVQFFGPKVHRWLEELDEVVEGRGDGVVAVKRGRLEGIEDTVVLHFGHVGVLRPDFSRDVRKVHEGIYARLSGARRSSR